MYKKYLQSPAHLTSLIPSHSLKTGFVSPLMVPYYAFYEWATQILISICYSYSQKNFASAISTKRASRLNTSMRLDLFSASQFYLFFKDKDRWNIFKGKQSPCTVVTEKMRENNFSLHFPTPSWINKSHCPLGACRKFPWYIANGVIFSAMIWKRWPAMWEENFNAVFVERNLLERFSKFVVA